MPDIPPMLANVLEPRLARPARVHEIQQLTDRLRRIRLSGPALRRLSYHPGQAVEFRVSPSAFRHYTPMHYEPFTGVLDVLVHLHGYGPGSAWAANLQEGDNVGVLGPGGRFRRRDCDVHVFLGDETTLGLFHALRSHTDARVFGAVELESAALCDAAAPFVEPSVERLVRWGERGDALEEWIETVDPHPRGLSTCFYLAGHAQTIARLRSALRRRDWPRSSIRTQAYWATGKRGF